jgi:teichuronic acid biosynthesis glycosyltransferase TuaC
LDSMPGVKLLTFTTLYPNETQPTHGVFTEQRLRHLLNHNDFKVEVVAPVPWFPLKQAFFGRYAMHARVPYEEKRHGIRVLHPRYPVIPKIGMSIAPFLMAYAVKDTVRSLLVEDRDFDIIDAQYFYPDGVAAALLAKSVERPLVITALGSDINLIANYAIPRKLILSAGHAAAAVVTVSNALKQSLIRIGLPERQITVIPTGVDLQLFRPIDRHACRRRLGLNGLTLLSVGQLNANKGHDLAIQALVDLAEVTLMIAGNGSERMRLQALARSRQVADRVRFLGVVAHEELKTYYGAADAVVLASAREGYPNVLLESLACGTPVIASNVGGIPEIVAAPEAGLLMRERTTEALAEACRALFAHYPPRDAVRRYAERFSWDATVRGQAELYHEIKERYR